MNESISTAQAGDRVTAMKLPIWISSWEIECCQPDAIVGQPWTTYPYLNLGAFPWWSDSATQPIPSEVANLGVVTLDGTISTHDERTTITTEGVTLPIVGTPATTPIIGRLIVDAHTGGDPHPITGTVQQIVGIKYLRKDGEPTAQLPPVELHSTLDRDNHPDGFDEYLVTLHTDENHN